MTAQRQHLGKQQAARVAVMAFAAETTETALLVTNALYFASPCCDLSGCVRGGG